MEQENQGGHKQKITDRFRAVVFYLQAAEDDTLETIGRVINITKGGVSHIMTGKNQANPDKYKLLISRKNISEAEVDLFINTINKIKNKTEDSSTLIPVELKTAIAEAKRQLEIAEDALNVSSGESARASEADVLPNEVARQSVQQEDFSDNNEDRKRQPKKRNKQEGKF